MALEKYKRKKILNWIGNQLKSKLKFGGNVNFVSVAGRSPDNLNLPALYVFRGNDPSSDLTNTEREGRMKVHVVAFVEDDTNSLETKKADVQDEIEAALYEDITCGGNATQLTLKNADPTAFSLDPLGFAGPVLPPLGAVRMDFEVLFEYAAF